MMQLLAIEWLRFKRNKLNLWVTGLFLSVMLASAAWSGLAAREFRLHGNASPHTVNATSNQAEMHDAPKAAGNASKASAFSASAAAPPLRLPALGGLALSVRQLDFLSTGIKISTRSRHTDGRNSDQLFNPMLHELGMLDFATVFALLTPLMVIALSYGLVQEDRESGVWRLVCTQMSAPWRLVSAALSVRYIVVVLVILASSLLALLLDPGTSLTTLAYWLGFGGLYALVWFGIAGLFLLLPFSSGASAIGMLGVWLILTFASPALLAWTADRHAPMPSRLDSIIAIRQFQEQNNQQRQTLLTEWYNNHPDLKMPQTGKELPREITGLPAGLVLDQQIRPLMYRFDSARGAQFEFLESWSWLSPAMAALQMADRLAGIDAPRYAEYIQAVNGFEDQWRGYFVPKIMTDTIWSDEHSRDHPHFAFTHPADRGACQSLIAGQTALAALLLAVLFGSRRRFAKA
jgi:ABC-2 type transport system permease protein